MNYLKDIKDFEKLVGELKARPRPEKTIRICATGCRAMGALGVCSALEQGLDQRGLSERIRVVRSGCHGFCAGAVAVAIDAERHPEAGVCYQGVTVDDVPEIIEETIVKERIIDRLCWSEKKPATGRIEDIPFYRHQTRLVLRNCGIVDPQHLEDSLVCGGYASAARVLTAMSPEEVIEEAIQSGLRGRGGAGFPTGRKWQFARQAPGEPKYVICNADEGDPGAFMDRALLEGDPHLVLEGMIIGAYAIGANKGYIYVRAEYPIAIEHTIIALERAREAGLLGENILGSGFSFDLEIREGAGAFVCGEETSLIASIEGRRGMPRPRPPFPASSGLYGKPTNINNVETWANVPRIIEQGGAAYAEVGSETSKGTKIFALAGKVKNTGLVEVPMGATLRQIVYDIGGGIPRNRKFKAAQMGGPSGGCVPARYLDLPIDYDSVQQVGAIMGSGGLVVMDESNCMVDIARFFTDFVQQESCGKCVPCRIGTKRMLELLTGIVEGRGELQDIERLERLGKMISDTSLCGLGQTAANPVLSTIRYFREEYEAHIVEGRCPSNICESLVSVSCSSACPAHINVPEYVALIAEERFAEALDTIRRRNPFPSVCGRACDHPCETFCRRGDLDDPIAIRQLKRFVSDNAAEESRIPLWQGPRQGRVAIVGSGPAGLTAAYFLALMGREVKVFEELDVVGGLMAMGIPEYRLPREILQRDIDFIKRAGVEIVTNHRVGSLEELREEGYEAIFLGVGALSSARLAELDPGIEGMHDALQFLREVTLGVRTKLTGKVVVVGGGNAAIDAARSALRLGAESVTLIYRRTRDEMPAIKSEIVDALAEGVQMHFLVTPLGVVGNGSVQGVRCAEMELGDADESGRRRPIVKEGCEQTIDCDQIIVAIGQSPELDFIKDDDRVPVTWGRLDAHPVTQRSGEGPIFSGGDAVTGPSTLIEAIAAGQRAACAIDSFLGGKGELPPDGGFASRCRLEETSDDPARRPIREMPVEKRCGNFKEVVQGYGVKEARDEALRCLRCDLEK